MGSGSEVHRLIWCGNWFPLKLMRGACEWGSHPLPGFAAPAPGSHAPAGTVERAPVVASMLAGPGPWRPLLSGGGETTRRVAMRKGSDPGSTALWAPHKGSAQELLFLIATHHGPHGWTLWSPSTPHAPSGQDSPLRGGSWGQELLGRAVCCQICPLQDGGRGAEPLPAPLHCGSQNTCGAPGIALKASGEADQSQMIRIRVKPHLDSQHHGQVCQGDQDGFSEEVIMEPPRKAGQE